MLNLFRMWIMVLLGKPVVIHLVKTVLHVYGEQLFVAVSPVDINLEANDYSPISHTSLPGRCPPMQD